jgi:hypothetical protein
LNKYLRVLPVLLLLLPAAAHAQTTPAPAAAPSAQSMADAKQVIEILHLQSLPQQIVISLVQQLGQQILAANKGKEAAVKAYAEQSLLPAVRAKQAPLDQQQIVILANRFTDDELRQILAFYRSGAGAKLLSTGPTMTNEMRQFAGTWAQGVINDLKPQIGPELKKRGLVLPK